MLQIKRRLQDWLGITKIANRLPEIDLQMMSFAMSLDTSTDEPEGELPGYLPEIDLTVPKLGISGILDRETGKIVALDSARGKEIVAASNPLGLVRKGYDKHEG